MHTARADTTTTATTTTAAHHQIDMAEIVIRRRAILEIREATTSAVQRSLTIIAHMPTAIAHKSSDPQTLVSAHQAHPLRTFRPLRPANTTNRLASGGIAAAMTVVVEEEGVGGVVEDAAGQPMRET